MKYYVFSFLMLFLSPLTYTQTCDADNCNTLDVSQMPSEVASWGQGRDCNVDGVSDIRDLICITNALENLNPPVLEEIPDQTAVVNQPLSFALTVFEPDDQPLSFSAQNLPDGASISSDGIFSWTPTDAQLGLHRVRLFTSDGYLKDFQDLTIIVHQAGFAAISQLIFTEEDQDASVTLGSLEGSGEQSYVITNQPQHGSLSGDSPNLVYSPSENYFGADEFSYKVVANGEESLPAVIQFEVTPVNDPPLSQVHNYQLSQNSQVIDLTTTDVDSQSLTYRLTSLPEKGIIQGSLPNITYTLNQDEFGLDSFVCVVSDGISESEMSVQLSKPLPSPSLDAHNTLVANQSLTLSGQADHGTQVEISIGDTHVTVPVTDNRFSGSIDLVPNTLNQVYITALLEDLRSPSISTLISHDGLAPTLTITSPDSDVTLYSDFADVTGFVHDALSGLDGTLVVVNGVNAVVNQGDGQNGSFIAENVPLSEGLNSLTITVTDQLGNQRTTSMEVQRNVAADDEVFIRLVSGNNQSGSVNSTLTQPIEVEVLTGNGTPVADREVSFEVTGSDGLLQTSTRSTTLPSQSVITDAQGRASVSWQLGSDAGNGMNRVNVQAANASGIVYFCAAAVAKQASYIAINSGNGQRGFVNTVGSEPLSVRISDGLNPVANASVTFLVTQGSGLVNEQSSYTTQTNDHGLASSTFTFGPNQGTQIVQAYLDGNPTPIAFNLQAIFPERDQDTALTGVLSNQYYQPIEGMVVSLTINGVGQGRTETDANGVFSFSDIPAGPGLIHLSGLSNYPEQHAPVFLFANHLNRFDKQLHLLKRENQFVFDNQNDMVLSVDGMDGLLMTVKAGSMTLADGSRPTPTNPVTLNLEAISVKDLPKNPKDGATPTFAWSLSPAGAYFNPPIEVRHPNSSGLAPGTTAHLFVYGESTGRYDLSGRGRVNRDRSQIVAQNGLANSGYGYIAPPYGDIGYVINSASARNVTLDDSWLLSIGGHTVKVARDGSFRIDNIPFTDQYGDSGPGSSPDGKSDRLFRLIGFRTNGEQPQWLYSNPFQLMKGQAADFGSLTVSNTVPNFPIDLALFSPKVALLATQQVQLSTIGTYANFNNVDLTNATSGSRYYTSNPNIAEVDANGLVTAHQKGTFVITVVNEELLATLQMEVLFIDTPTIEGFVKLNGVPIPNATVRVGIAKTTTTDSLGFFRTTILSQRKYFALASANVDGIDYYGQIYDIRNTNDLIEVGVIELLPGLDADIDGLLDAQEPTWSLDPANPTTHAGVIDSVYDLDNDGLPTYLELIMNYNPQVIDSDQNGLDDHLEDFDGDGLNNIKEYDAGTSLTNGDTDGDGMGDAYEVGFNLNPLVDDSLFDHDHDGLNNLRESELGSDPFNPDTAIPQVIQTYPNGSGLTQFNQKLLVLQFNEPVNLTSNSRYQFTVSGIAYNGSLSIGANPHYVTLNMAPTLILPNKEYSARIEGLTDHAGNQMEPFLLTFTTPPEFTFTVANYLTAIPPRPHLTFNHDSIFQVSYDQPLNPASFNSDPFYASDFGLVHPGAFSFSEDLKTVYITASKPFIPAANYKLKLNFFTDLNGNLKSFEMPFSASPEEDTSAPYLVFSEPQTGDIDVSTNSVIRFAFSESVIITASSIRMYHDAGSISTSKSTEKNIVNIFPPELNPNEHYWLIIENVRDGAGNAMATSERIDFWTGSNNDTQAPAVVSYFPANQHQIPLNTIIRVNFNEAISELSAIPSSTRIFDQSSNTTVPSYLEFSSDNRTLFIYPESLLPGHEYTVTVNNYRDLSGNLMPPLSFMFWTGDSLDLTPPQLVSINPQSGATELPPNVEISMLFDEPVITNQGVHLSVDDTNILGDVEVNGSVVKFLPNAPLTAGKTYVLTVDNLSDMLGNLMPLFQTSFTISTTSIADTDAPSVVSTSPVAGTIVAWDDPITIHFNELINPASVTSETVNVINSNHFIPGNLEVQGSSIVFTPTPDIDRAPPPSSEYEIVVRKIRDLAGNTMPDHYFFTLRLNSVSDTTPPFVVSISPESGSTDLGRDQEIVVNFSESMNQNFTNSDQVVLYANSIEIARSIAFVEGSRSFVINAHFPENADILLVVQNLRDLSGNIIERYTANFRTGKTIEPMPRVTSMLPDMGSQVSMDVPILVYFSQPMDPSSFEGNFSVRSDDAELNGTWSLEGNGQIFMFKSDLPLTQVEHVYIHMRSEIKSANGDALQPWWGHFGISEPVCDSLFSSGPTFNQIPRNAVFEYEACQVIDPNLITGETIRLMKGFEEIPTNHAFINEGRTLVIIPVDLLDANSDHQLTLSGPGFSLTDSFTTTDFIDNSSPLLTKTIPFQGQENISPNTPIHLFFDEPINPNTLQSKIKLFTDQAEMVPVSFSIREGNQVITLSPFAPLLPNRDYTIKAKDIRDLAGNTIPPFSATLQNIGQLDENPPTILNHNLTQCCLPINPIFKFEFDEPINDALLDLSVFKFNSEAIVEIDFNEFNTGFSVRFPDFLEIDQQYGLKLSVQDLVGNQMQMQTFGFFTGQDLIQAAPKIKSLLPQDGNQETPIYTHVQVVFDQAINNQKGSLKLLDELGQEVPGQMIIRGNTWTFKPAGRLIKGHNYRVQIQDVEGFAGLTMPNLETHFQTTLNNYIPFDFYVEAFPSEEVPINGVATVTYSDAIAHVDIILLNRGKVVPIEKTFSLSRHSVHIAPVEGWQLGEIYQIQKIDAITYHGFVAHDNQVRNIRPVSEDHLIPQLLKVFPAPGSSILPTNGHFGVLFNKPVNVSERDIELLQDDGHRVSVSLLRQGNWLEFKSRPTLQPDRTYHFTIEPVTDAVGNLTEAVAFSFTTASTIDTTPPTALSISRDSNEPMSPIHLNFDEQILPSRLTNESIVVTVNENKVSGQLELNGQNITFTPSPDRLNKIPSRANIKVEITPKMYDLALNSADTQTFTLMADPETQDITRPFVTGFRNISLPTSYSGKVIIDFSEDVTNITSFDYMVMTINNEQTPVNIALLDGQRQLSLSYYSKVPNARLDIFLTDTITDLAGNKLIPKHISFIINDTQKYNTRSFKILKRWPSNLVIDNEPTLQFYFSEPIDPNSINPNYPYIFANQRTAIPATIQLLENGYRLEIKPMQPLASRASISCDLSGIRNIYGEALRISHFEYEVRYTFNVITLSSSNLPQNGIIEILFNKDIDPTSITKDSFYIYKGGKIPGTWQMLTPRHLRFNCSSPPFTGKATIYINGLKSTDGDRLKSNLNINLSETPDETLPQINLVFPEDGSTLAIRNPIIKIATSKKLNQISMHQVALFDDLGNNVPLDYAIDNTGLFTPIEILKPNTNYRLEIPALEDYVGNKTLPITHHFQTGDQIVAAISNTKISPSGYGLKSRNAPIVLQFASPVIEDFLFKNDGYITGITGTWTKEDGPRYIYTPDTPLPVSDYNNFSIKVNDYVGGIHSIRLTIRTQDEEAPPQIVAITPSENESIYDNQNIQITFDQPMIETFADLTLNDGAPVPISITLSSDRRRLNITPLRFLTPGSAVLHIKKVYADNGLFSTYLSHTFQVKELQEFSNPRLVSTYPARHGLMEPGEAFVFNFDQPIDPASVTEESLTVKTSGGTLIHTPKDVTINGSTLTFTLFSPLSEGKYNINLSTTIKNPLGFRIDQQARIVYPFEVRRNIVSQENAAIIYQGPVASATNVPINTVVKIAYNQIMSTAEIVEDQLSVWTAGSRIDGFIDIQENNIKFTPRHFLEPNTTYDVVAKALNGLNGTQAPASSWSFTTGDSIDEVQPQLLSSIPENDAINVPADGSFLLTFNKPIDQESASRQIVLAGQYPFPTSIVVNENLVTITPTNPLPGNTQVSISIEGLKDRVGITGLTHLISFTTGATIDNTPPIPVEIFPEADEVDVDPTRPVTIRFSEPVQQTAQAKFIANGEHLDAIITYANDWHSLTLTPITQLPENSLVNFFLSGIKDLDDNLAANINFNYTTTFDAPTTRPRLLTIHPPRSANNVPRNAKISFYLSHPIDVTTLDNGIAISSDDGPILGQFQISGQLLTFTPDNPLPNSKWIYINIYEDLESVNREAFYSDYITFRTRVESDAPRMVYRTNGTIPPNGKIELGFTHPLAVETINVGLIRLYRGETDLPFSVSFTDDNKVLVIEPNEPLTPGLTYFVSLTSPYIYHLNGQALDSFSLSVVVSGEIDHISPSLVQVSPPRGATDVSINASIDIYFDEAISPLRINEQNISITDATRGASRQFAHGIVYNNNFKINPFDFFDFNTEYLVEIQGIYDLAGNPMPPTSFSFTTGDTVDHDYPQLLQALPFDSEGPIPANAVINILMNEAMDPSSIRKTTLRNTSGNNLTMSYTLDESLKLISFVPKWPLAVNSFHTFKFEAKDLAGNPYIKTYGFSLTNSADRTAPQFLSVTPLDQEAEVSVAQRIRFDYDEPISTAKLKIVLETNGQPTPFKVVPDNGLKSFIITPINILETNATVRVHVDQIFDLSDNQAPAQEITFTTRADISHPE